jgi:hypothetical protein
LRVQQSVTVPLIVDANAAGIVAATAQIKTIRHTCRPNKVIGPSVSHETWLSQQRGPVS